jgi:hypothetical protein
MPNLELLHFEGVNMIEYEGNSKKKKKDNWIMIWRIIFQYHFRTYIQIHF